MASRTLPLVLLVLLSLPRAAGSAGHTCTFGKLGATGRKLGSKLKCHQRATDRGTAVDPACLAAAEGDHAARFGRAELYPPCFALGDAPAAEAVVDALVDDAVAALRPVPAASRCAGAKLAAVARRGGGALNCHRSAVARGAVVKADCLAQVASRFTASVARAERRTDCLTTGDAGTLAGRVDAFVTDAIALLRPRVPSDCAARKLRAGGARAAGLFDCHASGARAGTPAAPACLAAVDATFADDVAAAEAEGDCVTSGDQATLAAKVDAAVEDVRTDLGPVTSASACAERKLRESGDRAQGRLGCHGVATSNGWPLDATCLGFAAARFDDGFAQAETEGDCPTTGDAGPIGAALDAFVDDVVSELLP